MRLNPSNVFACGRSGLRVGTAAPAAVAAAAASATKLALKEARSCSSTSSCSKSQDGALSECQERLSECSTVSSLHASPLTASRAQILDDGPVELQDLHSLYTLGEELGTGAFGKVCRARCRSTGHDFAIKTVLETKGPHSNDAQEEISAYSELRHPYIARMRAFFHENGAYHMVLDLCKGGDLTSVIKAYRSCAEPSARGTQPRRSGIPSDLVARYIWQMLDGLTYLHESSFIHRDLKPDNYLLESPDHRSPLQLIDFGFACRVGTSQKLTRVIGSSYYAAPELLGGCYDQTSDVWSLGVTCYAMCADKLPFFGATHKEYIANVKLGLHSMGEEEWLQRPPELKDLILRMLAHDASARPSAKQLLAECAWLDAICVGRAGKQAACCAIS